MPNEKYNPTNDNTLTGIQQSNSGFQPSAFLSSKNFRFYSTATVWGYSTGYHEAAVTTDTFNFLRRATPNYDGTFTLPHVPDNSFFKKYIGRKVSGNVLEIILKQADGFRTDTAQTILSAPNGEAAGHSGSGLDTKGQAGAHDLLRDQIMKVVLLNPPPKELTEKSVACLFGSVMVTSMAPGEVVRASLDSRGLKAAHAKANWEAYRNQAKNRVNLMFTNLSKEEKKFVEEHSTGFMNSTNSQKSGSPRQIEPKRSVSPFRDAGQPVKEQVSGGGYRPHSATYNQPDYSPPTLESQIGIFISQPFRAARTLLNVSPPTNVSQPVMAAGYLNNKKRKAPPRSYIDD